MEQHQIQKLNSYFIIHQYFNKSISFLDVEDAENTESRILRRSYPYENASRRRQVKWDFVQSLTAKAQVDGLQKQEYIPKKNIDEFFNLFISTPVLPKIHWCFRGDFGQKQWWKHDGYKSQKWKKKSNWNVLTLLYFVKAS